jgi:hypothetical protein
MSVVRGIMKPLPEFSPPQRGFASTLTFAGEVPEPCSFRSVRLWHQTGVQAGGEQMARQAGKDGGNPLKGILGLILCAGFMIAILVYVPAARWFLLLALPAGAIVGALLYFLRRRGE